MVPHIDLCWQRAPFPSNLQLSLSPALNTFLKKFAGKCLDTKSDTNHSKCLSDGRSGMLAYTPLTFNYVVDSIVQRFGCRGWIDYADLEVHPSFNLARQTMDAWKNGQMVLEYSAKTPFSLSSEAVYARAMKDNDPWLRLLLVPLSMMPIPTKITFRPDVHLIDNFELDIEKRPDGKIVSFSASFPLLSNHGLNEAAYVAVIVDVLNLWPVFIFETTMSQMSKEEFCLPYPFPRKGSHQAPASSEDFQRVVVESCVESQSSFNLKLIIPKGNLVSDVKVTTNQRKPCESAHEVSLSWSPTTNVLPLTLSFPHPILVSEIRTTLQRQDGLVVLELKKAILEPWPCEFEMDKNSKWKVSSLPLWDEASKLGNLTNLRAHIVSQCIHPRNPVAIEPSTLNLVRRCIKTIFQSAEKGQEFFAITVNDFSQPDWYIQVHLPIRTFPNGSPVLILSALDNIKIQTKEERSGHTTGIDHFLRISASREVITLDVEDVPLLRFVLRLNSTRMLPSEWQKRNVPLDKDSPWLATFLSPLYLDFPHNKEPFDETNAKWSRHPKEELFPVKKCCFACRKFFETLKLCSRCKSAVYP